MKIIVDKEGRSIIEQMCDVALKTGGIRNLNPVIMVLEKMSDYVEPVVNDEPVANAEACTPEEIIQTTPFPPSAYEPKVVKDDDVPQA